MREVSLVDCLAGVLSVRLSAGAIAKPGGHSRARRGLPRPAGARPRAEGGVRLRLLARENDRERDREC